MHTICLDTAQFRDELNPRETTIARGYTGTDGGACTACEFGKITSASGNTPCEKYPAMYSARSLTAAHANQNPGGCIQFV